jgi:hypothetical protein
MRLIVNFATGRFLPGQARLVAICHKINQPIATYGAADDFEHDEAPYYFKAQAMARSATQASTLLWVDASIYPVLPMGPLFELIERNGYFLLENGYNNGQWCNDASLSYFGYSRDVAWKQPQVMGGLWGVSMKHPTGKLLLNTLIELKSLFRGKWSNNDKTESQDSRCQGHRHDQSVLSLFAAKHQLTVSRNAGWFFYGQNPKFMFNLDGCP